MRLTRHRPNTAGDVKSETLNGTAAIASLNSEQQPQSEVDSLRIPYTNGDSQTKDPDDETLNLSSHDLPAEQFPPLSSTPTTSSGNRSRSAYYPEEHISRTKQLESMSVSLDSSVSRVPRVPRIIGLSNGASVHDPPAQRQAEPRRSQNWHYMGEAFRSISEKHKAIVATRIRVREERNSLRRQREAVIGLDIRVANGLRELFNKRPNEEVSSLIALFEQLQKTRDDLLQQEDDYNIIEDDLIGEEFDLEEAENKIFPELPSGGGTFIDDQDIATYLEGLEPRESDGTDSHVIHRPEVTQYFSRVGDEDIIQESLDELRKERAHLVEEERMRARLGLTLDTESQDFLNQFDRRQNELQDQLARVREDLIKLQETLASDGDIVHASTQFGNSSGPLTQAMDELEPLEVSDPDLLFPSMSSSLSALPHLPSNFHTVSVAASARRADSLLLPDEDSSPVFPSPTGTPKPESIAPAAFINDWLLDMLRRSPREVQRLKSTDTFQQLQLKQARLAEYVLGSWLDNEDAMNNFSERKVGASSFYLSPNAIAESARISKTRSQPALATIAYHPGGLRRVSAPFRRAVEITFTIQQHERRGEQDMSLKARSM
jgi:hypothetical protein